MTPTDPTEAKRRLTDERAGLVSRLGELGADEAGDLTGDVDFGDAFADAAAATAARTRVLGLVDNLTASLADVDAALARLEDGTYGTCTVCGEPIGAERLEFRPTSIRCVGCKASAS
ncbi:MAG: TraR/DksA C4-type zinc finger protein [Acidimicrobiia bacterium]|nr:TraR/DksA C4-type zinc finger protein [Acidimicrobiia bacterium]